MQRLNKLSRSIPKKDLQAELIVYRNHRDRFSPITVCMLKKSNDRIARRFCSELKKCKVQPRKQINFFTNVL